MTKISTTTTYILLAFFLLCFILGINLGEVDAVLEKGVAICLSCIGIG
ncbi:MAG: CD1871A family CXXC motif-containing protein [Desulfoplanes sp.]